MARRHIWLAIAFSRLEDYPGIQIQLLVVVNMAMAIFQRSVRPLNSVLLNRIEEANEFMLQISTVHMFIFSDWVTDK